MKIIVPVLAFFLLIFACTNDTKQSTCPYGEPTPIFSDTLEAVRMHQFENNAQEAVENVQFVTGLELEVLQSGCEELRQEFQFLMDGDYTEEAPAFWFQQAAMYFQFVGSVSNQHYALYAWGQAIAEAAPQMKIGEAYEVQPHFEATVNKIVSKEQTRLIITLSQQASE